MPLDDLVRTRTHSLLRSLVSHRILLYCLVSVGAVSAVVLNALRNFSNFYSVAIYLSKSGRSVLVLANFSVLLALLCGHIVQRIFFGSLRANEVERLYDRLWFFITESLLAFTIFRDDFDVPFALMFGFLLFVKSFHWLAGDRIEWMDQQPYPGPSPLFHLRMTSLFTILSLTDFIMFVIAIDNTITYGVGGMVLFASEYGILMASIINTMLKYFLSTYELRRAGRRGGENAPPWENKSMWVFYIELGTDFLKLTTYLVFFMIIITFYGLPLNIVRDVYITARSFITRLRALHRYQTATRNMDQRYPNATEAELAAMSDRTCIICREDMVVSDSGQAPTHDGPNMTPKKLPCGHVFHFHCLRSWLERQQSCPTCRQNVLDSNPTERSGNNNAIGVAQQGNNNPADAQAGNNNAPGANNPLGNPLGLVGRLLGPQIQQAHRNVFGQARPVNPVVNNQNNANVVVEYHIQYQFPRGGATGAQAQNLQNPPNVLQPIPPFQGFNGPNGVWQPWPTDQQNNTAAPTPNEMSSNLPTQNIPGVAPHVPETNDSASNMNVAENNTLNPREAVAQATMRRMFGSEPRWMGSSARPPTSSAERSSSNSKIPTSSTSSTSSVAPSLIPLYDFTTPQPYPGLSQMPRVNGSHPTRPNHTNHTPTSTTPSTAQVNLPLSQLPQQITDDQLTLLDQMTREAIDERLRVLEGVSGTLHRCVEELLRVRSALPVTEILNETSQRYDSSGAQEKGKGKDINEMETSQDPSASTPPSSNGSDNSAKQDETGENSTGWMKVD